MSYGFWQRSWRGRASLAGTQRCGSRRSQLYGDRRVAARAWPFRRARTVWFAAGRTIPPTPIATGPQLARDGAVAGAAFPCRRRERKSGSSSRRLKREYGRSPTRSASGSTPLRERMVKDASRITAGCSSAPSGSCSDRLRKLSPTCSSLRTAGRRQEQTVRAALGASRGTADRTGFMPRACCSRSLAVRAGFAPRELGRGRAPRVASGGSAARRNRASRRLGSRVHFSARARDRHRFGVLPAWEATRRKSRACISSWRPGRADRRALRFSQLPRRRGARARARVTHRRRIARENVLAPNECRSGLSDRHQS